MNKAHVKTYLQLSSKLLISISSISILTAACGPLQNPIGKINDDGAFSARNQTGGSKQLTPNEGRSLSVPYTISGSQKVFNDMRIEMESVTDIALSKTVESVTINLTNDKDEAVTTNPTRAKIRVQFISAHSGLPSELNFDAKLFVHENQRIASHIIQADIQKLNFPFAADIKCHDLDCRVIELRLKKYPIGTDLSAKKLPAPFGQVGILYSFSYPKMRVERSRDRDSFVAPELIALDNAAAKSQPVRTSVVVVNGPSYSKVKVDDLLEFNTELLDTEEAPFDVSNIKAGNDSQLNGQLSGNDPVTGSIVIDVENKITQDIARIFFEEEEIVSSQTPTTPPPTSLPPPAPTLPSAPPVSTAKPTAVSKSLFNINFDATTRPASTRVTTAFANYGADPHVQKFVKAWMGDTAPVGCKNTTGNYESTPQGLSTLKKFLTYTPNVAPHLERVVEKLDVTPEIGYLLLIESRYSKDPSYPALEKASGSSALGPWQIVNKTALDIRQNTNPTVPFYIFKTRDPRDDRTYFMNSTYMASLYLDSLFDRFKEDPALAIMAYNGGPGTAGKALKEIGSFTQFRTTLSEIQKYNIQTKKYCAHINYAYTFLAARTIGQNLEFYGLDNIAPAKTDAYKARLKSPHGTLPPGL